MSHPADSRSTILVADPEPGMRELFCYCFDAPRYEVETAASADEAVEAVRRRAYDLVVLDLTLPPMTGQEAMAEIRKLRPGQKLLLLSSGGEPVEPAGGEPDRPEAPCLFKPISLDELTFAVESLLASSPVIPEGEMSRD